MVDCILLVTHVSNLITGQLADNLVQIVPDTMEKYNNGMRGKELAQEIAKDEATNALWNVGGEFVLPSLIKGIGKGFDAITGRNVAQAGQAIEDAAKSAPISEPVSDISKEINPIDLAKQNSEGISVLADQQKQAADVIQDLGEQIPETL